MTRDRRDGPHDRRVHGHRRLIVTAIVGAYAAQWAALIGLAFAVNTAGDRAGVADREARAALSSIRTERYLSCLADETDRTRERQIGERYPDARLPPVPAPRDCTREADRFATDIAALLGIEEELPPGVQPRRSTP